MPGPILHLGATVICAHGGQAIPVTPSPNVLVSGQPVVTLASMYTVAGCAFPPQAGGPCVTGQWTAPATRVLVMGQPVLVQAGVGVCAPTGTPLTATQAQVRALAT
jgi:hypothetical protein